VNGEKYLARVDGLTKNNRLLAIVVVVMLVWNIANWGMATAMQSKTQVVVVPIGAEGMQIGNGRASERYIRRMARYITHMLGNYTAATARQQMMELLDLFPASKTKAVQERFEKIATDIERFPSIASSVRWVGKTPLRYDESVIQVEVRKDRLVNGVITDSNDVVYCLSYTIRETKFELLNVREKEKIGDNTCRVEKEDDGADRDAA